MPVDRGDALDQAGQGRGGATRLAGGHEVLHPLVAAAAGPMSLHSGTQFQAMKASSSSGVEGPAKSQSKTPATSSPAKHTL